MKLGFHPVFKRNPMRFALITLLFAFTAATPAIADEIVGTLKGNFGEEEFLSIASPASIDGSINGVYSGYVKVRAKAHVTRPNTRVTCSASRQLPMAFYLEALSERQVYVVDASGTETVAKKNNKTKKFTTPRIKLGSSFQQLSLSKLNGSSVKSELKVRQILVPGAECHYTLNGTLYRN